MSEPKVFRYPGTQATVTWNEARCMHAGECTRGLPAVFSSKHDPWGQPDNAPPDALADVVNRCPSGALQIEHPIGIRRAADTINTVTLVANGPLNVRGRVNVGAAPTEDRVALCRCGKSSRKPYCDHSHKKAGFAHDGALAPAAEPSVGEPVGGADLAIELRPNGPLHCTGSVAIVGTDGARTVLAEVWLCRCGGSSRKPFCDGTHRRIGFVS